MRWGGFGAGEKGEGWGEESGGWDGGHFAIVDGDGDGDEDEDGRVWVVLCSIFG